MSGERKRFNRGRHFELPKPPPAKELVEARTAIRGVLDYEKDFANWKGRVMGDEVICPRCTRAVSTSITPLGDPFQAHRVSCVAIPRPLPENWGVTLPRARHDAS